MDRYQNETGEEREWVVDAAAAWKKTHHPGARVRQLLSDSKKKMKLIMIGRGVGGSKTTPPTDVGPGGEGGARALLEQVSHNLDEDGTSTLTSVYTYNNYTERNAGAVEPIQREMDQKYDPWESTPKTFDTAQALPVVAAGCSSSSSSSSNNNNNKISSISSTSNENIAIGGAAREVQRTPTTTRFPEIWRKKQQTRTAPVASVTFPDDIEKDNDLESSSPHCSCPCGSTSNNSNTYTPPATYSSIDNTNNKQECTPLYQQVEQMMPIQYAQKKSDMADICQDLMQQQEKLSREISNEIIHTRYALVAEQELVAQRQEQQTLQNIACSRRQEEQNAKLDAILTVIKMINQNIRTTTNPMATTSHHHAAAHVDIREEEFTYLAALMKKQKRDILGCMEEAFATRVKKAHGQQNGGSHDDDDDDIATLKAENALLKSKNKSLKETLVHLQWQQDKLLTENAALHERMVAQDSKTEASTSQRAISKDKQRSTTSHEQREEEIAEKYNEGFPQTISKSETVHGIKMLARNNNRSIKRSILQSGEDCHATTADDTITFTSTITSSSRSDDNNDQEEQEHAQDQHECGLHQQQHKRHQPSMMMIVGSHNRSHARDLEEIF